MPSFDEILGTLDVTCDDGSTLCERADEIKCLIMDRIVEVATCGLGYEIAFKDLRLESREQYVKGLRAAYQMVTEMCDGDEDVYYRHIARTKPCCDNPASDCGCQT